MKEKLLRCRRALCVLLAVLLPVLPLSGCGGDSDAAPKPEIEVNPGGSRTEYPYMARTASATWYFAADDIALLGEDAFYEGLYAILENQEQDFADARQALKGYITAEIPPVDIYTYFSSTDEITELTDALYQDQDNYIVLMVGWDHAGTALLHEYVHYLTQHCTDKPAAKGFYAEAIAEYVSKLVCKNRMARRMNLSLTDAELALLRSKGAWDETEDCIDLQKAYYGQAQFSAQGGDVGTGIYTVTNTTEPRTEEMYRNPTVRTVSHMEAACILAYLIETCSMDTVMASLSTDPEDFETVYGEPFSDVYWKWAAWNAEKCRELGIAG